MLLVTSTSCSVLPPTDVQTRQRNARREVLLLLTTATCLLVLALLLGRTPLGLAGAPGHRASWTDGPPGLAALRLLRIVLLAGSVAFVTWLAVLALLCVPRRTAASTRLTRLPFGQLVRAALVGTVAVGIAASSGGAVVAATRPAVVADDATGGQRWPDLPRQPIVTAPMPPDTSPSVRTDAAVERAPTIPRPLLEPNASTSASSPPKATSTSTSSPEASTSTSPPTTNASAADSIAALPAGPSLADAFEQRFAESRSPIATHAGRTTADEVLSTRIVRAGESFWSIAEDEVLTSVDEATDAAVVDYWHRLIERNRSRLPDPTNPDLLWTGLALVLPPIAPGP